ncbi:MAG TPA: VanZ family protein [Acidobacteriaceae bacterium]|nr:VanZ family protein [Acidobacteriaceae bacterium]
MRPVFFNSRPLSSPRENYAGVWWVQVWLPVLLAVLVIAVESTDTFAAQHTSRWLRPIIERFFGTFKDASWELFHHYLRKTGHFVGYGMVAFTFLRAWLHSLARQDRRSLLAWRLESSILAILCTATVATCDEIHQTFLPSRTGAPLDVLLDTAGATTLCIVIWLICWTRASAEAR